MNIVPQLIYADPMCKESMAEPQTVIPLLPENLHPGHSTIETWDIAT